MMGNWKINENVIDNTAIYYLFKKYNNNEVEPFIDYNNERLTTIRHHVLRECKTINSFYAPNVTCVAYAAFMNSSLAEYNLNSIIRVMDYAFYNCSNYHGDFEHNLQFNEVDIGNYSFYHCNYIKNLYANYINIGSNAFILSSSQGEGLQNIFVENAYNFFSYAFSNQKNLKQICNQNFDQINYIHRIGNYTFNECTNLTNVYVNTINYINSYAFNRCTNLTIFNANYIGNIGANAFNGCTNLVQLSNMSINVVNTNAFNKCNLINLINVELKHIRSNAFQGSLLTNLVNVSLQNIQSNAFDSLNLKYVTINNLNNVINSNIFNNCTNLSYIQIDSGAINAAPFQNIGNNTLTINLTNQTCIPLEVGAFNDSIRIFIANNYTGSFNDGIFQNCTNLVQANIGKVSSVSNNMFNGCIHLNFVNSNGPIGDSTFKNCNINILYSNFNNVTNIGNEAFNDAFYNHIDLSFDNTVQIGNFAFNSVFSNLSFPIITSVYTNTFGGYKGYKLNLPNLVSTPIGMCENLENLIEVQINNIHTINDNSFSNVFTLELINCVNNNNLSYGQFTVGEYAFYGCNNLTDFICNNSNLFVNDYAFYNCINFRNKFNPRQFHKIGNHAFDNCSNLDTNIIISQSNNIGEYAFNKCSNLKNLYVNEGSNLGVYSFVFSGLTNITFAGTNQQRRTVIQDYAFANCTSLENVTMPANGIWGVGVFSNCTNLNNISLSNMYDNIPSNMFYQSGLTEIGQGPITFNSIGNYAFYNCKNLITVNTNTRQVNSYAFWGCSNLTDLNLSENLTSIGSNAFRHCNILSNIPQNSNLTAIGSYAFANTGIIYLSCRNYSCFPVGMFQDCIKLTTVDFTNSSIQTLNTNIFYNCNKLTTITNAYRMITSYGINSMRNTNLNTFNSTQVISIGSNAFRECANLVNVSISSPNLTSINSNAFRYCINLTNVNIIKNDVYSNITFGDYCFAYNDNLNTVSLPYWGGTNGITLGQGCFCNTSFITITNTNQIKTIGNYCFANHSSNLNLVFAHNLFNTIPNYAFRHFGQSIYNTNIDTYFVNSIGAYAFANCNEVTLYLRKNEVCTAESSTFLNCNKVFCYVNRTQLANYKTNEPWATLWNNGNNSNFILNSV